MPFGRAFHAGKTSSVVMIDSIENLPAAFSKKAAPVRKHLAKVVATQEFPLT